MQWSTKVGFVGFSDREAVGDTVLKLVERIIVFVPLQQLPGFPPTVLRRIFLLAVLLKVVNAGEDGLSASYRVTEINELADKSGVVANLKLVHGSDTYGPDLEELRFTARCEEQGRVHVHITDAVKARWEVPTSLIPRGLVQDVPVGGLASGVKEVLCDTLRISWTLEPFTFAVSRRESGEVLFDTAGMPLVFKDQYLEFANAYPEGTHLYGVGDSTRPEGIRLKPGRKHTLWATDVGSLNTNVPLNSVFPYVFELRPGGRSSAFLFLNSNGMDVEYFHGDVLNFKSIGGVMDFYWFAGPSPREVLDQFTALVGRPVAVPYWSLGFHQARFGYLSIGELETVMAKYEEINFPVEAIWTDIEHMDNYKVFTLDPLQYPKDRVRKFIDTLHAKDQKFVFIADPGIAIDENYPTYTRGLELGVYLKNGSVGGEGSYYIAQVWPGWTTIPDFLHPKALDWWAKELEEFHKLIPYDALWLDMNEPAQFCTGSYCYIDPAQDGPCPVIDQCCMICDTRPEVLTKWDDPPYKINGHGEMFPITFRTVAGTALHHNGTRHYDAHNLYGMSEAQISYLALQKVQKKRPFVLSRACYVGSATYAARWTGDNSASWNDLRYSMIAVLNSGLVGAPFVGADICGFLYETTEELCMRWTQLGAFYPFARSHSDRNSGPQEFYLWESVSKTAAHVFNWRYRLLPFFYTLLYESSTTGAPVARPLLFEYPEDPETWANDRQYLLGNAILVSPVLEQGETSVRAYFPKGTWYNLFDFSIINAAEHGKWEVLPAAIDEINVHIRRGSIIPMQESAMTTTAARKTPYTLLVALAPSGFAQFCAAPFSLVCDHRDMATGSLFVDDDEQISMEIKPGRASFIKWEASRSGTEYVLRSTVTEPSHVADLGLVIDTISVLGVEAQPFSIRKNGHLVAVNANLDAHSSHLKLSGLNLPLGENFELTWTTLTQDNVGSI